MVTANGHAEVYEHMIELASGQVIRLSVRGAEPDLNEEERCFAKYLSGCVKDAITDWRGSKGVAPDGR